MTVWPQSHVDIHFCIVVLAHEFDDGNFSIQDVVDTQYPVLVLLKLIIQEAKFILLSIGAGRFNNEVEIRRRKAELGGMAAIGLYRCPWDNKRDEVRDFVY